MRKLAVFIISIILVLPCMANPALEAIQEIAKMREMKIKPHQALNKKEKMLSENYYFVFIYKATCPHCQKFAPILKSFADTYYVKVKAYGFDGSPIPEFPNQPLTPEIFKTFYVDGNYKPTVPALFLVNKHTNEAYAVLFGDAEPYELSQRVDKLLDHIEERFHA